MTKREPIKPGGRHGASRIRLGFTLIELLVVIAIISLLVSILLPSLQRAKDMGVATQCSAGLRHLAFAMTFYAEDYEEHLPPCNETQTPTDPIGNPTTWIRWFSFLYGHNYLNASTALWWAPANDDEIRCPAPGFNRQAMNAELGGARMADVSRPTDAAVIADGAMDPQVFFWGTYTWFALNANRHMEGIEVVYGDNHVAWARGIIPTYDCPPALTTLGREIWPSQQAN